MNVFLCGLMVKSACFVQPLAPMAWVQILPWNITHGTLNGGELYLVYYAGATERPWTSLNE